MEAYLHAVSTRKVDDLVQALGADTGISKSEVSRICADLDAEVGLGRVSEVAGTAVDSCWTSRCRKADEVSGVGVNDQEEPTTETSWTAPYPPALAMT
jgi:hypothetical protein